MHENSTFEELLLALRSGTANEDDRVRVAILAGSTRDQLGRDLLWDLLSDPSEEVRRYAISGLVLERAEKSPAIIHRLWELFETDPDEDVRSVAVASLGSALRGSREKSAFLRLKLALSKELSPYLQLSIFDAMSDMVGIHPRGWAAPNLSWREVPSFKVDWNRVEELESMLDKHGSAGR